MRALDHIDMDLLRLLKRDARTSVTDIAATLGVSRVTVNARMAALRADGIIRRFTIDVADSADQDFIRAVSLLELDLSKVDRVHRALQRMPEFSSVFTTNGKWALVATSETKTLAAFDALLNRMGRLPGVLNVETCLLLTRIV